jgi:hypothetical protein
MRLATGQRGDPLHKIEQVLRRTAFLVQDGLNDFRRLNLEKPRLRENPSRSSSLRATIRSRAALMPAMNGAGDESAKRA